jgi:hypothetical protein
MDRFLTVRVSNVTFRSYNNSFRRSTEAYRLGLFGINSLFLAIQAESNEDWRLAARSASIDALKRSLAKQSGNDARSNEHPLR